MPVEESLSMVRAIWRDRMHTEPGALERSPQRVQARFAHAWAPAEIVTQHLQGMPAGWLRLWMQSERGHLVFTHQSSRYVPGPQAWRDGLLDGVAYLSVTDLAEAPDVALACLLHLLDHLLGCGARTGGAWFSEGAGLCSALQDAAQRFQHCHTLGYSHQALGVDSAPDYFAYSILLYLRDRQRLNTLDPVLDRLYAFTLWQEHFWRRVLTELAQGSGEATRS
jgi:hypothetical protein